MALPTNLYAVLGVSPEAVAEDIREAYRLMARRFHPDANPHPGAGEQFKDIATAYAVLGDPTQRANYDALRRQAQAEPAYFTLRVTPSKRVLPTLNEPQVLYLLLDVVPMRGAAQYARDAAPLNLTLVLDRSTSMRGARLDKVKIAAHQIIDQLSDDDVLSIVSFSDRAEVLIPAARVQDRTALRSQVSILRADGGTEIWHGLSAGVEEARKHADPLHVNHVILLTDGRTFGDEERCLELAAEIAQEGIGLSAMGIGEEWNDTFLDQLASITGGTSTYVNSPSAVIRFLNERVRHLGDAFAERLQLTVAPDADVRLESAFKLQPDPQPMDAERQPIPIGLLSHTRYLSLLLQFQLPPLQKIGFRTVVRLDVTGDVLPAHRRGYKVLSDISVEVAEKPGVDEPPPTILDALGKLTLYRMQQKADEALAGGRPREATRRLENLATRLLAAGQEELAQRAIVEARRIAATNALSEEGRKALKFGTRRLLAQGTPDEDRS